MSAGQRSLSSKGRWKESPTGCRRKWRYVRDRVGVRVTDMVRVKEKVTDRVRVSERVRVRV